MSSHVGLVVVSADRPGIEPHTENFWLEAGDEVRFTIEPSHNQAEGEGVEPSSPEGGTR